MVFVIAVGGSLGWAAHTMLGGNATSRPNASACIANVHDGDTIRTCDGERIRISNIDAPEMRGSPKCRRGGWCDFGLAEQSRDELAVFLASGTVTIARSGTDKYHRTLATVAVNGQDAGEHLIARSLARPWL
ncbi:thermonuclease family protein [Novosphingobium sp. BL-52-GroH]|uniref:thermonuclease family protein n=1 Tax=Novosphingobium sp. BL-52-GroH TaxID=3349877 RepID=UPI00384C4CE5